MTFAPSSTSLLVSLASTVPAFQDAISEQGAAQTNDDKDQHSDRNSGHDNDNNEHNNSETQNSETDRDNDLLTDLQGNNENNKDNDKLSTPAMQMKQLNPVVQLLSTINVQRDAPTQYSDTPQRFTVSPTTYNAHTSAHHRRASDHLRRLEPSFIQVGEFRATSSRQIGSFGGSSRANIPASNN